jgi:hypothetical protein
MFNLFFLLLSLTSSFNANAATDDSVKIRRILEVQERDERGNWRMVSLKGKAVDTVEFTLQPFSKGGQTGHTANARQSVKVGTLFRSEVRVSALKSTLGKYWIYSMLRSGPTLRRHGKIKNAKILDLRDFPPLVIEDEPIQVGGRTLRATLRLEPAD